MLIHNPVITGSFLYNGIDISDITGSETSIQSLNEATASLSQSISILSGSYLITSASYSATSESYSSTSQSLSNRTTDLESTASVLTTASASFAIVSSSFSSTSQSIASRINIVETSYATTGSNSFTNSQQITGSLTVSCAIIAQSLNVQQVTSSIVYSCGSNQFGCSTLDVQQFTGSLQVSGSSHYILGSVGVGTTNPSNARFELNIGASITTLTAARINLNSGASSGETIPVSNPNLELRRGSEGSGTFLKFINQRSGYSGIGSLAATNDAHDLRFHTGDGSEKIRITPAGVACFSSTVCAPAFVGGTVSGTTVYGSTVVCGASICTTGNTCFGGMSIVAGCVGIGTASPGYKLDIRGGQDDSDNFLFNGLNIVNTTNQGGVPNKTAIRLGITSDSGVRAAKVVAIEDGNNTHNVALAFYTNNTNADDSSTERMRISSTGAACFACELTAKSLGTNDLILNNLNHEYPNYVDGTRGSWLIQEGACDLFIINQVSCKKYKFNLIEIK